MEAANRGAWEAGSKTLGDRFHLPFEQVPNPYITPELNFEFHYFFMRNLLFSEWEALVVFPGGFGTFDEMFELLTLVQTEKLAKHICVVVYSKPYLGQGRQFSGAGGCGGNLSQGPRSDSLGDHAAGGVRAPAN